MTKLEYADFHKFIASLGVALIALSFALPWLFFKEPFDLYIEQEKLVHLTPIAKQVIESRQKTIATLICLVPIFSLVIFLMGGFCLYRGLPKWKNRQDMEDAEASMSHEALKKSHSLSAEDIAEKGQLELEEIGESKEARTIEKIQNSMDKGIVWSRPPVLEKYLQIENEAIARIEHTKPQNYELLSHRRIAGREFDAVLASKTPNLPDILIEIKYFTKVPSKDVFYRIRDRLVSTEIDYKRETKRPAVGLLIILTKDQTISRSILTDWLRPILDLRKEALKVPLFLLDQEELSRADFAQLIAEEPRLSNSNL